MGGGGYIVQNNEWGSTAPECITTDGQADSTVVNSDIASSDGKPGGYPSIYAGCHWGLCAFGGLASAPQLGAALTPGKLTTQLAVAEPADSSSAYDVSYDLWINQLPTTRGEPNGTEIMVWLDHKGHVQPAGSVVASGVTIGDRAYDVWYARGNYAAGGTVTYQMTSPVTSVSNLDLSLLVQNSVLRGYASPLWYLISVEAGFEIWQGGAGLAVSQFGVHLRNSFLAPPWLGGRKPPPGSRTAAGAGLATSYFNVRAGR